MQAAETYSAELEEALHRGVLRRLPLTFLPFVNQQLRQWEYLFPNERQSVERLVIYVAGLSEDQSTALFRDVVSLEEKMGVRHWNFSTTEQTIESSSELARSPYFQEWRSAVQAVFDAADRHANGARTTHGSQHRVVLIELPKTLSLHPEKVWSHWQDGGKRVQLDLGTGGAGSLVSLLLGSRTPEAAQGLLSYLPDRHADVWVIDAGRELVDAIVAGANTGNSGAVMLSYARLDTYRQNFSHEMNSIRKDLADADAVWDRLRKIDVSAWCPPEVASDAAVREFVRSVYLSGNGAVLFSNSFVEWTASEAIRRARPSVLAARFGVRSKPKPFTGVAIFENQDQVNPLPAVDDIEGSAMDAEILALYIWLAAGRYEEYQSRTVCVCIAESLSQAYIVAPPEFSLVGDAEPVPLHRLRKSLLDWVAQA